MQRACLNCVIKHLMHANVLWREYQTGDYPMHKYYVIGELAAAEAEAVNHVERADIRSIRHMIQEDNVTIDLEDWFISYISQVDQAVDKWRKDNLK